MLINLLTDTATLVEYKVISTKTKKVCETFNLRNVKEILSIPVKTISEYDRLTQQPMTELCRLHEVFSEGNDSVECSWIAEANHKPTIAESGRLQRGFQCHSITSDGVLTDLKEIAKKIESHINSSAIDELYKMYGNVYLLAADALARKSRLRNLDVSNPKLNSTMRLATKEILAYAKDNIFVGNSFFAQYIDKAINRLETWRASMDALNLYESLDKKDKRKMQLVYEKALLDLPRHMRKTGLGTSHIERAIEDAYAPSIDNYIMDRNATQRRNYLFFIQIFKEAYEEAISKLLSNTTFEVEEAPQMSVSYPYLTDEEVKSFINPLDDNRPNVPALFGYVKTILRSNDRNVLIRREMVGLNFENKEKSRSEIAEMVCLTEPSVKMIIDKPLIYKFDKGFQDKLYSELNLMLGDDKVISSRNPVWERILTEFKLNISVRQLMMVMTTIFRNSDVFTSVTGTDYLFRAFPSRRLPMMTLLRQFETAIKSKRREQRIIDFHDKLQSYLPEYVDPISIVFEEMIEGKDDVRQDGVLRFVLGPNAPDINVELESILAEAGEAIRLEEIYNRFKGKFPDEDITISTMQIYLSKNDKVSFKGLSRYYFLKNLDNQFEGTITDLLLQTLKDKASPVGIDELTEVALNHFPKTSKKSIAALLSRQIPKNVTEVSHHMYKLSGL